MNPRARRLPTHVLPRRYDVHLDARIDRGDFSGRVAIALELLEPTRVVELHARDLALSEARITAAGSARVGAVELHPESETAVIAFDDFVPAGSAALEIAFAGKVSPSMEGIYVARDGPEVCLATQFQETDARGVFPCFDEPTFKAEVAWRVTTAPGMTVLTNGTLVDVREDEASAMWTFAPTRPISTYLAAVVIGEFKSTPEERVNGVPLRVWALHGKEALGDFSQRLTARLLPWFEDYFATPYPYGKYDQVAVPGFSAGAMENVGLVTFRQPYLLMNPKTASWRQERQIARVVAHEFAHMWFGNLVTMRWWDDVWLNESFAEWMAHKVVHDLEPGYRIWDEQSMEKAAALASDALESTHAIYTWVETPEEATELFDRITYSKGAAVMRMLENFLGEDVFRAGLRTYMREFAEKNAAGADLWRHLQSASGEPVDEIMSAWVTVPGHPLVSISLDESGSGSILRLSQQRFRSAPGASGGDAVWPLPLVVRYADDLGVHETRHLLAEREGTLPLDVEGSLRWCVANAHGVGVYRQDLDDRLLGMALAHADDLAPAELTTLLDDAWGLARNGSRPISRFLDTLDAVASSEDHAVLERVVEYVQGVEEMLADAADEAALEGFRAWAVAVFKPRLDAVGLERREGEGPEVAQRRVALVEAVAAVGRDADTVSKCVALADREAKDPASVEPALAVACVTVAAKFGDRARMDEHVAVYEKRRASGASPHETDRYLYSFPAFEEPELVARTFQLMDERVLPQESVGPLMRILLRRRHSRLAAWDYLKAHWVTVRATLGDMWTGNLVEQSGNLPGEMREDMVVFYDANLKGVATQSYARALESLDQREEFRARTRGDLVKRFREA